MTNTPKPCNCDGGWHIQFALDGFAPGSIEIDLSDFILKAELPKFVAKVRADELKQMKLNNRLAAPEAWIDFRLKELEKMSKDMIDIQNTRTCTVCGSGQAFHNRNKDKDK